MGVILYTYQNEVYVNLTNKCSCNCVFCVRSRTDTINGKDVMWHDADPTLEEVVAAMDDFDFTGYDELVYCGYGEPTCALDVLLESAKYFKKKHALKIRLNTNGIGRLYNGRNILPELNEVVDAYSISLNAPNAKRYDEIVRPQFQGAFDEMLSFSKEVKASGKEITFSVVTYISEEEVEECKRLAEKLAIPLKVREFAQ